MEYGSETLASLVKAFSRLPGIGTKTAQRLALFLLRANERRGGAHSASCFSRSRTRSGSAGGVDVSPRPRNVQFARTRPGIASKSAWSKKPQDVLTSWNELGNTEVFTTFFMACSPRSTGWRRTS